MSNRFRKLINSLSGGGDGVSGLSTANGGDTIADNEVIRGDGVDGIQGSIVTLQDNGDINFPSVNDPTSPTINFGDGDSGIYESSDDVLQVSTQGNARLSVNSSGDVSSSTGGWTLANSGEIRGKEFVDPKSSSPVTVNDSSDNRKVFTNEGASGSVTFNLPSAVAGLDYTFIVQSTNNLVVDAAAGDTIRISGSVSSAGGTAANGIIGGVLRITAINSTEWIARESFGIWTLA